MRVKRFSSAIITVFAVLLIFSTSAAANIAPNSLAEQKRCIDILHQIAGDDLNAFFGFTPIITIRETSDLSAYTFHKTTISISSGLLKMSKSDAEIAFILLHEIGHLSIEKNKGLFSETVDRQRQQEEIFADSFALRIMQEHGYEGKSGIAILSRVFQYLDKKNPQSHSLLALKDRLNRINSIWPSPV